MGEESFCWYQRVSGKLKFSFENIVLIELWFGDFIILFNCILSWSISCWINPISIWIFSSWICQFLIFSSSSLFKRICYFFSWEILLYSSRSLSYNTKILLHYISILTVIRPYLTRFSYRHKVHIGSFGVVLYFIFITPYYKFFFEDLILSLGKFCLM